MTDVEDLGYWNSSRGHGRFGQDIGSGAANVQGIGFSRNAKRLSVRSVRTRGNCRAETGARQLVVSREKDADRLDRLDPLDRRSPASRIVIALITSVTVLTCQLAESYLLAVGRCATCAMGMMGMFKWLRKDITHRERNGWNLAQKQCSLNNESYRNALQAFIERRRCSDDVETDVQCSPDKTRADLVAKNNNKKYDNERISQESKSVLRGIPCVPASEIFEVGWIAGTEDRYLELIFAEWQNTRVSLKRHIHPECKNAVKADLDVLVEIPHPNVILLMGITQTDDHGLVSIFESVDCTLYHYIHEQGERISIQSIAKCVGRLSDALRHSHALGYVHSAISSHCVYLASSGIVKLGGWELAMHVDNPKPNREYEERLRNEIFRWQAPELFHDCKPCKESDVYGLAMLIWEMCTMQVPWKGYSRVDVERQYAQRKRGVIMYLYDFPPLLHNLLEAALQVDVNKRTLDMNRMRRFLQRLEMQYEDEEPVYVDKHMNNNNEPGKTYILSPAMTKSDGSKLTKSPSTKQLFVSNSSESPTKQYLTAKKLASKPNGNVRTTALIEPINIFDDDIRRSNKDNEQKTMNVLHNIQNKYKKNNCTYCTLDVANTVQNDDSNSLESFMQSYKNPYKKVKAPQESTDSWVTSVCTPASLETTDDESFKDAITNLKQLKKDLADKREHFFYGSDSSQTSSYPDPKTKKKALIQAKSRNYEPHKPASHKTSIQPKYNKSPGQYDSSCMKSSNHQYRKIPYSHVPVPIKQAIAQPQVLNSDPQSFFETSLWRKEKLICLAKMRKSYGDELMLQTHCTQNTDDNTTVSTITSIKNTTVDSNSLKRDSTYVINQQPQATETEESHEGYTAVSEDADDSTDARLQVLKDALDRATKIVRSVTPNSDVSCRSPPFETYENFEVSFDNSEAFKSMFEELYNLHKTNDNEEIKTIEKSTPDDMFLFRKEDINHTTETTDNDEGARKSEIDVASSTTSYDNHTQSFNATFTRNFVCESILEVSSELSNSSSDIKSDKTCESHSIKHMAVDFKKPSDITYSPSKTERTSAENEECPQKNEEKSKESKVHLLFANDSTKGKDCNSCNQKALPRRRSLPAALGQLRLANNSALGKLPIRRGDVPDNTVEDLYIDDEFGDSLNVNMVLMSTDDDFLSDFSDLDITKE
ncbi:uncharacterized protein LOC143353714 isoform X2 [Halictus rubicundus]|uniref:uncharacterized protein LOC143353714 isoform X2 n=1 Tax=Halictus rubicundus TaxID=77578 RepID=UPI00403664D7